MKIGEIKLKTLVKIAIIALILYKIYDIPRADWDKGITLTTTNDDGSTMRLVPKQSGYIKYILAWWKNTMKTKGITGIIDEYILAPIGITFENK